MLIAIRIRKSSRIAHPATKLSSSLNAYRAITAEPPRSGCSVMPSKYVSVVITNRSPATRKTSGVSPSANAATTPSAK